MFAEPGWDIPFLKNKTEEYIEEDCNDYDNDDCLDYKNNNNLSDSDKLKNHYTEMGTLEKENFEILQKINSLQNKYNKNTIRIEELKNEIESIKNPNKKILKP